LTIAISGWLKDLSDTTEPWLPLLTLTPLDDILTLTFDSKHMINLGSSLDQFVKTSLTSWMGWEILSKMTVVGGVLGALTWPAWLVTAGGVLDNPYVKRISFFFVLSCKYIFYF